MKQPTKRLFSMSLALFFTVGAFVIYFSFIKPAYEDIKKIRSEEFSRRTFTDRQSAVLNQVKKLISAYKGQGELQDAVSLSLPLKLDEPGALAQLNGLLENNRLLPQSFSVSILGGQGTQRETQGTPTESFAKPLITIFFKVRFAGAYEDIKNFLVNLETNIRIFDVRDLFVSPVVTKGSPTAYNVDLTVATYSQSP
ncbi:MAG: hypothetical protein HYT13_00885 [Candidatus Liptonbacteria bacterium]|nr:hypothetical protein [Candidatus Liptonbacteria bacterium]